MAQWKVSFFLGMAKKMKASRSIDERGRKEGYEQVANKPAHSPMFGTRPSYRMSDTRKRNEDRAAGHAAKTNSVYYCSSQSLMRRWIATFAFLLLGWTSVEPAAFAFEARKPLCCQKNGKHHCAEMTQDAPDGGGSNLRAFSPSCPHQSQILFASAHFQFAVNRSLFFAGLSSQRISFSSYLFSRGLLAASERFDRGPPIAFHSLV